MKGAIKNAAENVKLLALDIEAVVNDETLDPHVRYNRLDRMIRSLSNDVKVLGEKNYELFKDSSKAVQS